MDPRPGFELRRGEAAKEMSSRRRFSLTMRRSALPVLLGTLACSAAVACGESGTGTTPPAPKVATLKDPGVTNSSAALDAGATAQNGKDDLDAGAEWTGPYAGALFLQTPIMSDMEWPRPPGDADDMKKRAKSDDPRDKVVRLGYMRQGARVPVLPEAHKKSNCAEGWYELVAGGFVCGKYASIDLNHPRFKIAPHLPDMTSALPYQYGYNVANGTPLYRHIPSREDRLQLEPWLNKKKAPPKPREDADTAASPVSSQSPSIVATAIPVGGTEDMMDAGVFFATARSGSSDGRDGRMMLEENPYDAGVAVPWYLRDYDGGKPQGITLDDLKGEGPVARRMVKGFYLALDKEVPGGGTRWWKTVGGMLAPYDRIYVQKPVSEYHGVWLRDLPSKMGDAGQAPTADEKAEGKPAKWPGLGFILYPRAKKYIVSVDHKHVNPGDSVSRFTPVRLTGDSVVIGGLRYDETEDNWWMRGNEGTHTDPGAPPDGLAPFEKWVDVNLTTETMVAFEGVNPVYATLVSTGKRNFEDKEKDHPTPPGTFRIREKHIAATMDGDVASDSPYSIEDVPWIMYFNGSYALHGAFWHGNWGHTQSHGCVNLSPLDAKAMFGWTEPRLPEGWHGVMSTTEHPGTRVVVHGEAK